MRIFNISKHLIDAYRESSQYEQLEQNANEMALLSQKENKIAVKAVQEYNIPSKEEFSGLTAKWKEKKVLQFYKNFILPRRVILYYMYVHGGHLLMEDFAYEFLGHSSDRYFHKSTGKYRSKLKHIFQTLGFSYYINSSQYAFTVLQLNTSLKGKHLLSEEEFLLKKLNEKSLDYDRIREKLLDFEDLEAAATYIKSLRLNEEETKRLVDMIVVYKGEESIILTRKSNT